MAKKNTTPRYIQIAVDVASRIAKGELKIGKKISGRSTLASEYNVSPETIRKAMSLLEYYEIVEVVHGKGVHVFSVNRAEEFMERNRIKFSINELKYELMALMKQRDVIEEKMNDAMNSIIDYSSRFQSSDHITVYEFLLDYETLSVDKSLDELDFKTHTGITLVGIKRDGINIISPDGSLVLKAKDKILYVGVASASLSLGEYLRSIYD